MHQSSVDPSAPSHAGAQPGSSISNIPSKSDTPPVPSSSLETSALSPLKQDSTTTPVPITGSGVGSGSGAPGTATLISSSGSNTNRGMGLPNRGAYSVGSRRATGTDGGNSGVATEGLGLKAKLGWKWWMSWMCAVGVVGSNAFDMSGAACKMGCDGTVNTSSHSTFIISMLRIDRR